MPAATAAAETPKPSHRPCSTCTRSALQLAGMPERWECAHVACPLRRTLTAGPGDRPQRLDADGCWRRGARPLE